MHLVHSLWPKIVQGDDTCHHGSECGGDLRIADIGNVLLAFDHKMMNLRLESPAHLRGGPGEIDEHAAGINHIHAKSVRLKPRSDAAEIGLRHAEPFTQLLRSKPVMEIGRTGRVEFIEKLLQSLLLLRGALQLQKHVLHRKISGHRAAVVRKNRLRTRVATERDAIRFIDSLSDSGLRDFRARKRAGFNLPKNRRRGHESHKDNYGEEPRFAKHGSPS